MKIIGLFIDGIRKLKAVSMKVAKNGLIEIHGLNKQGKTTIIDSMQWLLCGDNHFNDGMISKDAKSAKVSAELEGGGKKWSIKRVKSHKSGRLEVKNEFGYSPDNPQTTFLNGLYNDMTFNPFPFKKKTPHERAKFVMNYFGIDFEKENAKIKQIKESRTLLFQALKKYGDIPILPEVEELSSVKLYDERNDIVNENSVLKDDYHAAREKLIIEINEFNATQIRVSVSNEKIKVGLSTLKIRQTEVKRQIEAMQKELKVISERIVNGNKAIENLPKVLPEKFVADIELEEPEYHELTEIDAKLKTVEDNNNNYTIYKKNEDERLAKAMDDKKYKQCHVDIKEIEDDKKKRLAEIPLDIEGLELTEDDLLHNGISSANWSSSEEMSISFELCALKKPRLQAVFLDGGETYDGPTLKVLDEKAKKYDIQCFITIVERELPKELDADTFWIEEGEFLENQVSIDSKPKPTALKPAVKTPKKEPVINDVVEAEEEPITDEDPGSMNMEF